MIRLLLLAGTIVLCGCWNSSAPTPTPPERMENSAAEKYHAGDFFADAKVAQLAEAAKAGETDRVDALISQGVNVNARGEEGLTPLMYAMSGRTTKGFERLLRHHADPNLQTERGESAMSWAAHRQDSDFLKLVLAHGGDVNLRSRLAPKYTDNSEPTPIFDTIRARNPANARMLIRAGADLSVRDSAGWTPLLSAFVLKSYEVAYVLLEAGADFRAAGEDGLPASSYLLDARIAPTSPLAKSRQKCMEFMQEHGVDFEEERGRNAEIMRQIQDRIRRREKADQKATH